MSRPCVQGPLCRDQTQRICEWGSGEVNMAWLDMNLLGCGDGDFYRRTAVGILDDSPHLPRVIV